MLKLRVFPTTSPESSVGAIGEAREKARRNRGRKRQEAVVPPRIGATQRDACPRSVCARRRPSLGLNINKTVRQCGSALFPVNKTCRISLKLMPCV